MTWWDRVLELFGTNRVRMKWRMNGYLPHGGRRAPRTGPVVTGLIAPILGAACIGLYALSLLVSGQLGAESGTAPAPIALVRLGAVYSPLVRLGGEWWRTVTAIFLHGSLLHILMNGLGLWVVGSAAEERFGAARTLVAFVVCGTAGEVTTSLWSANVLSVGASGGIFGLIALCTAHGIRRRDAELKARFLPWLVYGLIVGFALPGTDNAAHVGGLVTGAIFGLAVGDVGTTRGLPRWAWTALAVLVAAAVAIAFVLAARSELVQ
jgi:rhomboid protease GluP